jgi:GTP-binding protein HflX
VDEVLADLKLHETPVVHVFNKIDALSAEDAAALRERMENLLPNSLFVSALGKGGFSMEPLRAMLLQAVRDQRPLVKLRLPAASGKLIAEIHRDGEVVSSANDEETGDVVMSARVDAALLGRLEREGVVV